MSKDEAKTRFRIRGQYFGLETMAFCLNFGQHVGTESVAWVHMPSAKYNE